MSEKKVLFLCTGNSCRSQMAEAIVNHHLAGRWHAFSAGTQPAGYVHPLALQVLEEIGIQHQGSSKTVELYRRQPFERVITVCDDAAETCPLWLGQGARSHLGFRDPAKASGTPDEILAVFRQVRDQIRAEVLPFLEALD